jgi:hypothetical protein
MLRDEDLQIELARTSHGDALRLIHVPTGISRNHPGRVRSANRNALLSKWASEIEDELLEKGLTQYIIPDYRPKHGRRRRK